LIVDDEPLILKVYADLLSRIGYDVLTASGGKEAIALAQLHREAIRLVILDMIMPDMNGRETYAALQEVMPGMKVLLASGYSIDSQANEILAQGCNGFIQKPFKLAALSEKLKEIL
jgi:two-component system cell cycle sensor histidine kinase/response regulator CckA